MDTKEQTAAREERRRKIDYAINALTDLGLVVEGARLHQTVVDLDVPLHDASVPAKLADVVGKIREALEAQRAEATPRAAAIQRALEALDVMCEPERPPPPPPPQ